MQPSSRYFSVFFYIYFNSFQGYASNKKRWEANATKQQAPSYVASLYCFM